MIHIRYGGSGLGLFICKRELKLKLERVHCSLHRNRGAKRAGQGHRVQLLHQGHCSIGPLAARAIISQLELLRPINAQQASYKLVDKWSNALARACYPVFQISVIPEPENRNLRFDKGQSLSPGGGSQGEHFWRRSCWRRQRRQRPGAEPQQRSLESGCGHQRARLQPHCHESRRVHQHDGGRTRLS